MGPTNPELNCGEIIDDYYAAPFYITYGTPLIPTKVGNMKTAGGDSGAPIISWAPYNELYGSAVGQRSGDPNQTYWSTPVDIESDLNVIFCLNDACTNP